MSTETAEVVSATVELTYADGKTRRIQLDNHEASIYVALDVIRDAVWPPAVVPEPGGRQGVILHLSGRGPLGPSSAGPIVSKEPQS